MAVDCGSSGSELDERTDDGQVFATKGFSRCRVHFLQGLAEAPAALDVGANHGLLPRSLLSALALGSREAISEKRPAS